MWIIVQALAGQKKRDGRRFRKIKIGTKKMENTYLIFLISNET